MSEKTVKKAHYRTFLNPPDEEDTASVGARYRFVLEPKWKSGKKVPGEFVPCLDSDLLVRSCYDSVTLHFGVYNAHDIAKRRKKLALLRDALDVIEQGLDIAEAEMKKEKK